MTIKNSQSRGAVLLIAILVASVALAVGMGVYNRTYKELLFASYWKQTQVGFSAADAGLECALYNDTHPTGGVFPSISSGGQSFSCFGINGITATLEPGSPSGGVATSTFSASVANGCVNVTVVKSGASGPFPLTFVAATTTAGMVAGPIGVAVSPDGTSVYVADINNAVIYQYSRATTTGNISPMTPSFISSTNAQHITVSPDGKSVYAMSQGNIYIDQYDRDIITGVLTLNAASPYTVASGNPAEMVISSDGLSAYVAVFNSGAGGRVLAYDRSAANGALTNPRSPGGTGDGGLRAIAISPQDDSVYAAGDNGIWQYSRDKTTGNLTVISPSPFQINPPFATGGPSPVGGIVVSPDGRSVYKTNNGQIVYQYSRNTTLGPNLGALSALTPISTSIDSPPSSGAQGIVISPDGSSVYVTNAGDGANSSSITASQFQRAAGGLLSLMTPASTSTNLTGVAPTVGAATTDIAGIAITRDGKSVYITNFNEGLIYQFKTGIGDSPLTTTIHARGYNTPYNTSSFDCANTSPRRVERGLRVSY